MELLVEEETVNSNAIGANPVTIDAYEKLHQNEILSLFKQMKRKIDSHDTSVPLSLDDSSPVLLKEGSLFVYYLGPDSQKWESKKMKLRSVIISNFKH